MDLKFERFFVCLAGTATALLCGQAAIGEESGEPRPISAAEQALLRKAAERERAGDWAGVVEALKPSSDSLSRKGLLQLARAYGARKDWRNQIVSLEMLKNKSEKDYYALSLLGDAYAHRADEGDPGAKAKDLESAAGLYREAIDANKEFQPAYEGLLKALEKIDDRFEARSVINDMIKKFGRKASYVSSLCRLYSVESFIAKAIETCKEAIELSPKTAENYVYLGLSYREKENLPEAERALYGAAKRFPSSEFAQWAAGDLAHERKNFTAAYQYFIKGTAADALAPRSWLGAGKAALEDGRPKEAFEAYLRACELDRRTLSDYRKAAGLMRQRKLMDWSAKFEAAETQCGSAQKRP